MIKEFYKPISRTIQFRTLLKLRKLVWERNHDQVMSILKRKDHVTFADQFNSELVLSLCKNPDEQKYLQDGAGALSFYQKLIDKF